MDIDLIDLYWDTLFIASVNCSTSENTTFLNYKSSRLNSSNKSIISIAFSDVELIFRVIGRCNMAFSLRNYNFDRHSSNL